MVVETLWVIAGKYKKLYIHNDEKEALLPEALCSCALVLLV